MPPKFAFPIRTPFGSRSISMSLPGIARHIVAIRFAATLHPADRYSITQQDCIATTGICQQVECDFFPGAAHSNCAHPHSAFDEDINDFAIEQIHGTANWLAATIECMRAAAPRTCASEKPP